MEVGKLEPDGLVNARGPSRPSLRSAFGGGEVLLVASADQEPRRLVPEPLGLAMLAEYPKHPEYSNIRST
jgi:hypothetical protein